MNEELARILGRFLLQCERLGIVTVNRDRLREVAEEWAGPESPRSCET